MFTVNLKDNESRKHVSFFEDDQVRIQFERTQVGPLIHCEVSDWGQDVLGKCYNVLAEICTEFNRREIPSIFALIKHEDRKHKKFVSLFGFDYFSYGEDTEGNPYEFWKLDTDKFIKEKEEDA